MNAIRVTLWTGGTTYRNSFKAHIFCSSRHIQQALDHSKSEIQAEIGTIL